MTYDKESFLAGLAAGRALWRPPAAKARPACLVFTSAEEFSFRAAAKSWDGVLETSTDGAVWTAWDGVSYATSAGGVLMLRGTGNTTITTVIDQDDAPHTYQWSFSSHAPVYCDGSVETLLDWRSAVRGRHPQMAEFCFDSLFAYFYDLVTPPALPAAALTVCCYSGMFAGCRSLAVLPALPAAALAKQCCFGMFEGCTSLHLSSAQTGAYPYAWRIPASGTAAPAPWALDRMFTDAGGPFTGTPTINTTYYTDRPPVT